MRNSNIQEANGNKINKIITENKRMHIIVVKKINKNQKKHVLKAKRNTSELKSKYNYYYRLLLSQTINTEHCDYKTRN